MKFSELDGKKILILGYGKEGRSTERILRLKVPGANIAIADQAQGADYLEKQQDCDIVVKTPGIPLNLVTAPHTTATNIFFANIKNQVIGVTGSKGKSTTASLIHTILKHAGFKTRLVGNIGSPALDVLLEPVDQQEIFVMELSSYQLEDIEYSPHVSVITSIFHEHLDHHGSFKAYFEAKARILAKATVEDFYVFNPAYAELGNLADKTLAISVPFAENIPFVLTGLRLEGEHNLDNIRGALVVARILGVPDDVSREAILAFEPLPHRLTQVGEFKSIRFYDDAIATAPEPTIFAIQTLKNVDTIFLGGTDRGYDFKELAKIIASSGIHNVVLFPDTGERIAAALDEAGARGLNILHTRDMRTAVEFAYIHTAPGKICLLSTASPSYSLWKNFEEKGEEFVRWVREFGDS
jgi:UDP-N-acetylmuramoylalanine--D-glutamate ligase